MVTAYLDSLRVPVRREEFRRPSPLGPDTLRLTNLVASIRPGCASAAPPGRALGQPAVGGRGPGLGDAEAAGAGGQRRRLRRGGAPGAGADDAGEPASLGSRSRVLRHGGHGAAGAARGVLPGEPLHGVQLAREPRPTGWWSSTWSGRRPPSSAGSPTRCSRLRIWSTSSSGSRQRRGTASGISESEYAVVDDHLSFQAVGVPAVDVIGFNDPNWHTRRDDPRHTSAERLGRVGTVMAELIWGGHLGR